LTRLHDPALTRGKRAAEKVPAGAINRGGAMVKSNRRAQRLVALFLLGCLLFNYPLLVLFNRHESVFGIPLPYAYLFSAWMLVIVLAALVMEKRD
jgi:hypothetical protein